MLAATSGFDGVMTSEHHGGFAGYLPNPLQVTNWLVERMPTGWAAPCPLLLPLRPVVGVAEEIAWLAALHPGRVGVGVASGALPLDFEVDGGAARRGGRPASRPRCPGWRRCCAARSSATSPATRRSPPARPNPVPVVSTAMSLGAVRRAAGARSGCSTRVAPTRRGWRRSRTPTSPPAAPAPRILIRRVWLGAPPKDVFERQLDVYRSYSPESALAALAGHRLHLPREPGDLADELADGVAACGATALNLRVHVPGVGAERATEQIAALGAEVLPLLREPLGGPAAGPR